MKGNKAKPKKANYNADAIEILKQKYGVQYDYIRKSISGDRVGLLPQKLKKEYNQLDAAAKKAVKEASKVNSI